jgi:hypothetical protein
VIQKLVGHGPVPDAAMTTICATYALSLRPFSGASLPFVSPLYRRVSAPEPKFPAERSWGQSNPRSFQRLQIAPAKSSARLSPDRGV